MDQTQRAVRRNEDVESLYKAIGEFIVKFEQTCAAIQFCIIFILSKAGLKDQSVSQIILAGMTAEPLRSLFESLVGQRVQLTDSERKIVQNAISRFQKLTQDRNDIIHSTWYIGYGNGQTEDFSTASGMKFHKNKKGAAIKSFEKKKGDFALLSSEASDLAKVFQRLSGCFTGGFSVEKNFVVEEGGRVSVPSETNS